MPNESDTWNIPEGFNFARDVVEALAGDPLKRAVTHVDSDGVIQRFTFAEVAGKAAQWTGLLAARGASPGDRVLVALGKEPAWLHVMLACLKSGLIAVPCSDLLEAAALEARASHCGARLAVVNARSTGGVRGIDPRVLPGGAILDVDQVGDELSRLPVVAATFAAPAVAPALILYTSGTTRDPRGATHTHAYTFAQRVQAASWLDAQPGDLVWCTAGTGWAKAIWNILLGPWSRGAEIVLHDAGFDPVERLELIDRVGATILCQSPTEYRVMAEVEDLSRRSLSRLRHAVSTGEPLPQQVLERWRNAFGVTIHSGYGQTETSLLVASRRQGQPGPGRMGFAAEGHDVAVIDGSGSRLPIGVEGDLAVRGHPPTLFQGYWGDEAATAAAWRDGWYVTGDRALLEADGAFRFIGRADQMIESGDARISPVDIETVLLEHEAVAEVAVVGKPRHDLGSIVKAFVVLAPGTEPGEEVAVGLAGHVRIARGAERYPREFEFVDALPKTWTGKVDRTGLAALEAAGTGHVFEEPPSEAPGADTRGVAFEAEAQEAAALEAEREAERVRMDEQERASRETQERERLEAEAETRRLAEADAAAEEARRQAEAEAERVRAEAEARFQAEAAERRRAEEGAERERAEAQAEAERVRAETEARFQAEAAERRRAEEDAERERAEAVARERREAEERARLEAEAQAEAERLAEEAAARERREAEERARLEVEAQAEAERLAEEARLRAEEAAERAQREAEAAERRRAEEEAERGRLEAEARARREAEEAEHRRAEEEAERRRLEAEAQRRRAEEEIERRRVEEEAEAEARRAAEAAERRRADEEAERRRLEAEAQARREAEEEQRIRLEVEAAERRRSDEQAKLDAEAADRRRAEEERLAAELEAEERRRAETEARLEAERLQEETRLAVEEAERKAAAEEARSRATEEARRLAAEESRLRSEAEQRRAEEDAARTAADLEARLRDEVEARRRAAEAAAFPDAPDELRRSAAEEARRAEMIRARATEEARLAAERVRSLAERRNRDDAERPRVSPVHVPDTSDQTSDPAQEPSLPDSPSPVAAPGAVTAPAEGSLIARLQAYGIRRREDDPPDDEG